MAKLENKISRTLSLVLRHDPASIGLTLDPQGWAKVDDLIACLKKDGRKIDLPLLERVVETPAPEQRRFSFSADRSSIRANDGHSVPIAHPFTEKPPPDLLYHATALLHMDEIEIYGLLKMDRPHVHLFHDPRDAHVIGQRHGKHVILEVASRLMASHDFKFYLAENGVWLTDTVPPDYLNRQFKL